MHKNSNEVKNLIKKKPPYVMKLSSNWKKTFPNLNTKRFKELNPNFAILISKRKYTYKYSFNPLCLSLVQ